MVLSRGVSNDRENKHSVWSLYWALVRLEYGVNVYSLCMICIEDWLPSTTCWKGRTLLEWWKSSFIEYWWFWMLIFFQVSNLWRNSTTKLGYTGENQILTCLNRDNIENLLCTTTTTTTTKILVFYIFGWVSRVYLINHHINSIQRQVEYLGEQAF